MEDAALNPRTTRVLTIAAIIGFATAAFAAPLDGLHYVKEMTVKMKSGKTVTVIVGEMNGQTMAILPMADANDIFERAEGHSMVIP